MPEWRRPTEGLTDEQRAKIAAVEEELKDLTYVTVPCPPGCPGGVQFIPPGYPTGVRDGMVVEARVYVGTHGHVSVDYLVRLPDGSLHASLADGSPNALDGAELLRRLLERQDTRPTWQMPSKPNA